MNLRQVETNLGMVFFTVTDELLSDARIIQKQEFIRSARLPQILSGLLVQHIIVTQSVLIQDAVHGFTSITTKYFIC